MLEAERTAGASAGRKGQTRRTSSHADGGDGCKPDQHHGSEEATDHACAMVLHREQADQDHDRDRHDEGGDAGQIEFEPSTAERTDTAGVIAPSPQDA